LRISGLVTKDFTVKYSRQMADTDLQSWLESQKLVGITGVDTRALVRHIRTKGAMNAIISSETMDIEVLRQKLAAASSMEGLELASGVSTATPWMMGEEDAPIKVAVLDFGVKKSILKNLENRQCYLKVFP